MMTCSTLPGRAICRLVWNMDRERNLTYLERALSGVPEGFAGKLLEVPVGTGVLTMPVYNDLPDAEITCLDYSEDMMAATWARCHSRTSASTSCSLNGFHAFPNKDAAYRETYRVLKPGGTICGCFRCVK